MHGIKNALLYLDGNWQLRKKERKKKKYCYAAGGLEINLLEKGAFVNGKIYTIEGHFTMTVGW